MNYTGLPGVHNDGDGTTEGWFRAAGGSFVTTEPVGTEDWMPLNDYPSGTATEPDITGPGLAGPGFYGTHGGECKNV